MKILVVGTGSIGKRHSLNLKNLIPDVEMCFFRESGRHDTFSLQMNAEIITSVNQISNDINAVFLCSPAYSRKKIYERIFDLNIPLYAEKPLFAALSDIVWLKSQLSLQKYTAPSLVGFNLRFLPVIRLIKDFIDTNKLGNVCRAYFEVGQFLPDWRPGKDYRNVYSAQKCMGGGVVLDLIHEVDLAYYFFGIFSNSEVISNKFSNLEIDTEDTAAIVLHRKTNPIVTINMDYVARKAIRQFRVVGDFATLSCDILNRRLMVESSDLCEEITLDESFYDVNNTYMDAVKEFISEVSEKKTRAYTLLESLQMHELILGKI